MDREYTTAADRQPDMGSKVESIEEKVVRIETAWLTVRVSQIYACLSNRVHGARSI
jgi:hypothetical protein